MRRSLRVSRLVGDFYFGDVASTIPKYEPLKTAVFLHGILGNRKNWRTPAKLFLREKPEFCAVSVDHRAHGHTNLVFPIPADIKSTIRHCVLDLDEFLSSDEYLDKTNSCLSSSSPHSIIAHSFGGKVALEYLKYKLEDGSVLPSNIWILDTIPGLYERKSSYLNLKVNSETFSQYEKMINDKQPRKPNFSAESALDILYCVNNAPKEYKTKKEALQYLYDQGVPKAVADWISTNLVDASDNPDAISGTYNPELPVTYSFNIEVIMEMFSDFILLDYFPFLENYAKLLEEKGQAGTCQIHIVRAEKNKAWTDEILEKMNQLETKTNGLVKFYTMPNVGHWLHSENPKGTIELITNNSKDMDD